MSPALMSLTLLSPALISLTGADIGGAVLNLPTSRHVRQNVEIK